MPKDKLPSMAEIIDEIGQKNETKGVAAVKKYMKMANDDAQQKDLLIKSDLRQKSKGPKKTYYKALLSILEDEIKDLDLPDGFKAWGEMTTKGIVFRMEHKKNGKKYHGAFKPCLNARIDYGAVIELLGRAIDTSVSAEDNIARTLKKMGVILPA